MDFESFFSLYVSTYKIVYFLLYNRFVLINVKLTHFNNCHIANEQKYIVEYFKESEKYECMKKKGTSDDFANIFSLLSSSLKFNLQNAFIKLWMNVAYPSVVSTVCDCIGIESENTGTTKKGNNLR